MDAENLSLPVSTVAEPTDSTLSWQPQPVTITSLADLQETAESYFSPEIVDNLFALSPDHYRDFDGVLYATDGGRGSNLYLLDKTVAAEQVDEDHWTVTVTFWADFEGRVLHRRTGLCAYTGRLEIHRFLSLGRPRPGGRYSLYHQLLSGL